MAKKHLSLNPHTISLTSWWYEENAGIRVLVEGFSGLSVKTATEHVIPWRDIRRALARKDRK